MYGLQAIAQALGAIDSARDPPRKISISAYRILRFGTTWVGSLATQVGTRRLLARAPEDEVALRIGRVPVPTVDWSRGRPAAPATLEPCRRQMSTFSSEATIYIYIYIYAN